MKLRRFGAPGSIWPVSMLSLIAAFVVARSLGWLLAIAYDSRPVALRPGDFG